MPIREAQAAHRLECRRTTVNGLSLHFRASTNPGRKEHLPIILIHGLASSHYMIPIAEHLASDFQVYALDLPGFGKSDKPRRVLNLAELADALAAWMASLGLKHANGVGNSLGCNVLVELALRHRERVNCLVLQGLTIDPAIRTTHQQVARWLINGRREPSMGSILFKDYADAGLRCMSLTFRHLLLLHHPIEDKLPLVHAPTLIVRGSRDPIASQEWAREAAHRLPHGRWVEIPGEAHTLNFLRRGNSPACCAYFLVQCLSIRPLSADS
ncbi:alpha/beta fold hydrolase [Nitrosococcus wardiae]|uniref:Alpha/beta fold hydrolase n=1 Tax=Nitrosococcus wardiae TaxID=1814290 RepID=A0A4P7C005_9GAMM|nr:alpha/beta fold hydrolase [Nitrosococcus wardiae]QBQ55731.1 alpha/beta fold hydrolase [Nitrosococcus wardiae]